MNIHQLSVSYQVNHDRILVQISTQNQEELRVWLTRRLLINLFPSLNQVATHVEVSNTPLTSQDDMAKKMLMEFKKMESITHADLKTPFNNQASAFPLGIEPLLVTSINLRPTGNGAMRIAFEEKFNDTSTPRGFEITMDSSLLLNFIHLLESSLKASDWGIMESVHRPANTTALTEVNTPTDPPQYMN